MNTMRRNWLLSGLMLAAILAAMPTPVRGAEVASARAGDKAPGAKALNAGPVVLHEQVVVQGDYVTLGDLFANAGSHAATNVAHAPKPGTRAVFDARWLGRLAHAYKLRWRPMSQLDRAVVDRASTIIELSEIEAALMAALEPRGLSPDMFIDVSNRMLRLHVPAESAGGVDVVDIVYNEQNRNFTAVIAAPAGDPRAKRTRVTGRVFRMIEVPVPVDRVLAKDIIGKKNIKWLRMRADRVQGDIIVDPSGLIGQQAKRGLRAGAPVRATDVRAPLLVTRGSLVTITLVRPQMTLTSQGKAVSDASYGEVVRVINTRSNTAIDATVVGPGRVAVNVASHQFAMK